ncbi:MAG: glycosyltransferase, partial [Gemmatimonadota bacterium]
GMDTLVRAFARVAPGHPELRLRIAGRGAPRERRRLQDLVAGAGIGERTEVIGDVDEARKGELLRRALFACMPSRYEGWGIAAVEAQAAGKAVLGTRIPGLIDAVRDGVTGVLVAPGQVDDLARGMEQLLAGPERRREMGRQARQWARRFDWDRIAHEQEAVLERAAEENGRSAS